MYWGTDGQRYNSRYDAAGYEPTSRELQKQQRSEQQQQATENRLGNESQRLDNRIKRQALNQAKSNHFYNSNRQFAQMHGRDFGPQSQGQSAAGQPGGRKGYGVQPAGKPGSVVENRINYDLVQSAGQLNQMLEDYSRSGQNKEQLVSFINEHPFIGVDNASDVMIFDDGTVAIYAGDDVTPAKTFNQSTLANLNNYASRTEYRYDQGNQVRDPGQLMEQLMPLSEQMADQETAHLQGDNREQQAGQARNRYLQQLLHRYGPRSPSYVPEQTTTPYRDMQFGPGAGQPQVAPGNLLDQMVPPPPAPGPSGAVPGPSQANGEPTVGNRQQEPAARDYSYWGAYGPGHPMAERRKN